RAMARYAPDFYWPKHTNSVEIQDRAVFDKVAAEGLQMLEDLKQKAEVEIELLPPQNDFQMPIVKLAGGAGVNREAARLALEDMVPKGPGAWAKAGANYDKFRAELERQAILLGRQAIKEVQL